MADAPAPRNLWVEVAVLADWQLWRDLRLEALHDTPIGFGERYADAL